MTTIYTTDAMGVFAGALDVDPYAALPPRSTLTPPPAVVGEQVARLTAGAWEVLPAYPTPSAPPVPVPASVTMRQARLALLGAGLLDDVDTAIASIPDETTRRAAQIEWEFSNEVQRNNSFTALLGAGLGLGPEQVDALFIQAAAL